MFPNACEPGLGSFVRARLQAMCGGAQVKAVAPLPLIDYSRLFVPTPVGVQVPRRRKDGRLEIFHPRWWYLPWGAAVNPVLLFVRLVQLVAEIRKEYPFDLIDSHFAFPDGIAAAILARRFKVPFSITLRGNEPMHAARSKATRTLMAWAFRRAACVITVSESLREVAPIGMGANPKTARTIPNGVDHHIFYPRDRVSGRAQLGFEPGRRVIVSAGSLIERKGHHRVMEALVRLRIAEWTPIWWLWEARAGKATTRPRLRSCRPNWVSPIALTSWDTWPRNGWPQSFSAADLFCLASSREGWPNVVHEAMACGTPVVATDVGGTPDMIPSPLYGSIVPAADQPALESALEEALRTTWDREAIRRWAHARSWEQVAGEVLQQFESVMTSQSRG